MFQGLCASWRFAGLLVALVTVSAPLSAQTSVLFDAQETKLRAVDAGFADLFGQVVDIDGDRAVVGAHFDDNAHGPDAGSVYVFERAGNTWMQTARLEASDGSSADYFGAYAAIDGDTIVVGAYGDDITGLQGVGSVYVFALCGGVWVQQAHLFHPNGAALDQFGFPVVISGDTIAVSSFTDDTCAADSGSVWVYVRNTHGNGNPCDDTWDLQTAAGLSSPNCEAGGGFGAHLDLQGNRLVVGAFLEDALHVDQGAAYVHERVGSTWTMVAQLPAQDGGAGDEFGIDIAIDGDTILVGANEDDAPQSDRGTVHVFARQAGQWVFQQLLVASDGAAGDRFGVALALQGEIAVIRSVFDDLPGGADAGSAYVLRKAGANFVQDQKVHLPGFAADDQAGLSVALDGGTAVIGARRDDDQVIDSGSAFVVTISKGQFERFGFGDGSSTTCPCGNASGVGLEEGCTNSRLHGGTLSVAGTDSASADDFRMLSWNLIPGNPALLFSGPNRLNAGAGFVFGNGLRLVGGTTVRRGIAVPNADGRAIWARTSATRTPGRPARASTSSPGTATRPTRSAATSST